MTVISHTFPELGTHSVPLFSESKAIFDALQSVPSSGTDSLERLEHLGELRRVIHVAHHSRYEYLVLQLCLIHFFKKDAKARGLGSPVKLQHGLTISSGEELLKSWAILCENGHLYGVYEAERFWLGVLVRDDPVRKRFLSLFAGEARDVAERVLRDEDLGAFYRVLSLLFLLRAERKTGSKSSAATFAIARDLLLALFREAEAGSALHRCQSIFVRIRRLSYLYLDLARLPVELHFNSPIILQEFRKRPEEFIGSDDSQFQLLANALQNMLVERIYASERASAYKLERMLVQAQHLRQRRLKEGGDWFLSAPNKIEDHFQQMKSHQFTGEMGDQDRWVHFIRLRFHPTEYFPPSRCRLYSDEDNFKRIVGGNRWKVLFTPYQSVSGHGYLLDVFEDPRVKERVEGLVLHALLEHVIDHFREWRRQFARFSATLLEPALSEVALAFLRRLVPIGLRIEIPVELCHEGLRAELLDSRADRTSWSKSASWAARRAGFSDSRLWELECLRREVRQAPKGRILVCNGSVLLFSKENEAVGELDGVFFRVYGRALWVTIVESKTAHRMPGAKAMQQLKQTTIKLGLKGVRFSERAKYAVAECRVH